MAVLKEIIEFTQFSDKEKIDSILSLEGDKTVIYRDFFDLACINQYSDAAIYIYQQGLNNHITWDFIPRLKLAIKYQDKKLVKFLLEQNISLIDQKIDLIKYAINNDNSYATQNLLPLFSYEEHELIDLYDFAFNEYCYTAISYIHYLDPSLKYMVTTDKMNETLWELYHNYSDFSDEMIDFICYLGTCGANISIFNNYFGIPYMIEEQDYEKIVKLLLHGVQIKPETYNGIVIDSEYNEVLKECKESLDTFILYVKNKYPHEQFVIEYFN